MEMQNRALPEAPAALSQAAKFGNSVTFAQLAAAYGVAYDGRSVSRAGQIAWWTERFGARTLADLIEHREQTELEIHDALENLATSPAFRWSGKRDARGQAISPEGTKTRSGATVNRYAYALASLFKFARKKRLMPRDFNPVAGQERRKETSGRVRFLSPEERARLLTVCRASSWSRLYALVLLALTTGARRSELLGLHWADIDFERAIAYVARTKNGDAKALPLLPAVVKELERFKAEADRLVFPSLRRPAQPFKFEKQWRAALRDARIRDFRFHDLRHSCASYLAQSGASLLEIADVLGHRSLAMTRRYSHLTTQSKAALVARVLGDIG